MNVDVNTANPSNRAAAEQAQRRRDLAQVAWAVVLTIILVAALWFGVLSGGARNAATAQPTAVPTEVATAVQPTVIPTVVATAVQPTAMPAVAATAVVPGGSADDQATPTDQERAAAALQMQSTEQEYCPCNGAVQITSP